MTPLETLLQQLFNGLTIGAIYALIALGYTMVYGVIQLVNFAHGEVFMVGAYLALSALSLAGAWAAQSAWTLSAALLLSALAAMGGCALLGLAVERGAYRPLRQAPRLAALITAIGVSFFLQNAVMLIYGATDRRFPAVLPTVRVSLAGATVTGLQVAIWLSSGLLMLALQVVVMSTKLGMAMRAAAQDARTCRLLGIPVDAIVAVSFAIGSALAAFGGMLYGLHYNTINFHDGYLVGIKAFTAAVLGGIGNIPGAMLGGIVLGVLETVGAGYLFSQWKNVFAFAVLVGLLLFRPTGLLGERLADRA